MPTYSWKFLSSLKWVSLALLVLVFSGGTGAVAKADRPTVWIVCPTGCQFRSIQTAIDTARAGDYILVGPGTYQENLVIDKSLTLQGVASSRAVIQGREDFRCPCAVASIESDTEMDVVVENLIVTGAKTAGIQVGGHAKVSLKGVKVSANRGGIGISVTDSATVALTNSQVSNNRVNGLEVRNSAQVSLSNSQVSGNNAFGIAVTDSSQITVTNSTVSDNSWAGVNAERSAAVYLNNAMITGNGNSAPNHVFEDGLHALDSVTVSIANSTISGNKGDGLVLWSDAPATVSDSRIEDNSECGIVANPYQGTIFGWGNHFSGNKTDSCYTDAQRLSRTLPPNPHSRPQLAVPQDVRTIQQAIDLVADGGTITVAPGTYNETLEIVNVSFALRAAGKDQVHLTSDMRGSAVLVYSTTTHEVRLEGLTIGPSSSQGLTLLEPSSSRGIWVNGQASLDLISTTIQNAFVGLDVLGSAKVNLANSQVSSNVAGLVVGESATVTLIGSTLSDNTFSGAVVRGNASVDARESIINGNGTLVIGILVAQLSGILLADGAHLTLTDSVVRDNANWGLVASLKKCGFDSDDFTGQVTFAGHNVFEGNNKSGKLNGQGNPGDHPFKNLPDGQVCLP